MYSIRNYMAKIVTHTLYKLFKKSIQTVSQNLKILLNSLKIELF
jgi:hypothetical protein